MIESLEKLIENETDLSSGENFCAIIGLSPSQGARSPVLWNAVFTEKNLPLRMVPLDVKPENIEEVFQLLDSTEQFIAGALAVPYKETAFEFFNQRLDQTTRKIGAVNCLFRNEDNTLTGVNTDGEGALAALRTKAGARNYSRALVLGSGGTAKAVAAFLSPELGEVGELTVMSRNETAGTAIADACGGRWAKWGSFQSELSGCDLLVNCTTIGTLDNLDETPINQIELGLLGDGAIVYDVVYQPEETKLVRTAREIGLMSFGGLAMNMEQAVLACSKALKGSLSHDEIRVVMEAA